MFHLSIRDFFHMNNLKLKKKWSNKEVKNLSKSQTQALLIFYTVDRIKYREFHPKSILFIFEKKKGKNLDSPLWGESRFKPPFLSCCDYWFFFFFIIFFFLNPNPSQIFFFFFF